MTSSSTSQFGQNQWLVEEMYHRYQQDPSSVDASWHEFLADYRPGTSENGHSVSSPKADTTTSSTAAPATPGANHAAPRAEPAPHTARSSAPAAPKAPAAKPAAKAPAAKPATKTAKPAEAKAKTAATPNVLAISRADGELPVVLLVQTVPSKKKAPVLHLVESSTGKQEDFRITWEGTMLPGTELPVFDRRSVGTPVLRKGKGDLLAAPEKTLKKLANSLTWPRQENLADFRTNGYGPAVRRANNSQAEAVAQQATLHEKNSVRPEWTTTLLFEDGSAFVTGTIKRDTTFEVKANSILNAPESFLVFSDTGELRDEAVLRTTVMVGMRVPAKDVEFQPEVIAVTEQLIDAWGS